MLMAKVVVVGAGMMGTALCTPISDAGHEVHLVGTHLDSAWVQTMKADRVHPKLGIKLPHRVVACSIDEIAVAMRGVDFVCLGVSSAGVLWAAETIRPFLRAGLPVLSVTKGLAETSSGVLRILPDVLQEAMPVELQPFVFPAAIAGPCIAGELARRVPCCVVFTGRDPAILRRLADALATDTYHVRVSADVVGVEVCAALKNAYAMAVGIGAGMHERAGGTPGPVAFHNLEAALFAQSCLEIDMLVRALGGDRSQVPHLAGAGDLFVTCSGGRSSRLGRLLGMGLSFAEAEKRMAGDTLECAEIVRVVGAAIDPLVHRGTLPPRALPLMRHLHAIIVEGKPIDIPFHQFFGRAGADR
jgi:glycerol-3-phosphate dehydrogenase (NAD(P)+)